MANVKTIVCKILFCVSALLVASFLVFLGVDLYFYKSSFTSFPFYTFVIVRALEFLLPSLIIFVVTMILKRKIK